MQPPLTELEGRLRQHLLLDRGPAPLDHIGRASALGKNLDGLPITADLGEPTPDLLDRECPW